MRGCPLLDCTFDLWEFLDPIISLVPWGSALLPEPLEPRVLLEFTIWSLGTGYSAEACWLFLMEPLDDCPGLIVPEVLF
jgi:hypothetical protein